MMSNNNSVYHESGTESHRINLQTLCKEARTVCETADNGHWESSLTYTNDQVISIIYYSIISQHDDKATFRKQVESVLPNT